jgi:hypothetical protein
VSATPAPDPEASLRAEHDVLAAQLARRASIDEARKAIYSGFFGLLAAALAVKLAFDRWILERPAPHPGLPAFFLAALLVALVLLGLAAAWTLRARRHMAREDALYARFRQLRDRLGFDR